MAEFPGANSGGLDPSGGASRKPRRRRIRSYLILALACAALLGMAVGGGVWLFSAFRPGQPWYDRIMAVLGSVGLLAPLVIGIWAYIKARRGRGRSNAASGTEARPPQQCANRSRTGNASSLLRFAFKWAGYAAMQPAFPVWQRGTAWLVLILYALTVLGIGAMGIVMIGAGFGTLPGGLWIAGIGAAALYLPFVAIRSLVRGIRAGKLGTTREELIEFRVAHDAWRTRQSQMPIRSKILAAAFSLGILAFLWLHDEHRHPGKGGNWIASAIWLPGVAYTLWVQFRRPRSKSDE